MRIFLHANCQLPTANQQVNEYEALKDGMLYSWGELTAANFLLRIGSLSLLTFTVVAAPIAAASFSPSKVCGCGELPNSTFKFCLTKRFQEPRPCRNRWSLSLQLELALSSWWLWWCCGFIWYRKLTFVLAGTAFMLKIYWCFRCGRDGVTLATGCCRQWYPTKKLGGTMGKCGPNHPR